MAITNEELQNRLDLLIPGGAHTYSKGRDVFPSNAPAILKKGKGSKVWDFHDRRYLDYGMGLKSVVLGYSNREVNLAAKRAYCSGNNLSRPSLFELEAAEKLSEVIDSAEMVKFAKNGSNVTSAAIKLARAYTGRKVICVPEEQPFFSFDDWFIGTTPANTGVPPEHYVLTKKFKYGDIDSIQKLVSNYSGDIAAVMLEPAASFLPCRCVPMCPGGECPELIAISKTKEYLGKLKKICDENGICLIFDEMRTGFRWDLKGAQNLFGVQPHISTFGKAMANGYSLSALVGIKDIMSVASTDKKGTRRTFLLSSTHGAEMGPLGAFLKVVDIFDREKVSDYLWDYGRNMKKAFREVISNYKMQDMIRIVGPSVALQFDFLPNHPHKSADLATLFYELMMFEGVMMPTLSQSFAHSKKDLNYTVTALDNVLSKVSRIDLDNIYTDGQHRLSPVFRSIN